MNQEPEPLSRPPLTPAEQMLKIRETVLSTANNPSGLAGVEALRAHLQSSDSMQKRLQELEVRAWVRERPFESHAPVIGALIVRLRYLWNWMSTKWYVLPLLQQQNDFNVAAAQLLRETWELNRTLLSSVAELQRRLDALESDAGRQRSQGASKEK